MLKKLVSIFLVIQLVCLLLSACQNPINSPSPGDESSPDAKPSPSPAVTVTISAEQSWKEAYATYLRENIPTGEIDIDLLDLGSEEQMRYSAFLAAGLPVDPFFYLYDMDNNGTPELICIRPAFDYDGDVYTFKDNAITKLGNIKFYPFGSIGIPLDKENGLYSDVGYKGHYGEVYYYTIENDALKSQLALEYNNQPEISDNSGDPYAFHNFGSLDYYEVTEAIQRVQAR